MSGFFRLGQVRRLQNAGGTAAFHSIADQSVLTSVLQRLGTPALKAQQRNRPIGARTAPEMLRNL
jgi:hypothetical protein